MSKSKVTIEDLTGMVKRGFDEVGKGMGGLKKDVDILKVDMKDVKERVENIERLLLKQHTFQIQELTKRIRRLEDLFALK